MIRTHVYQAVCQRQKQTKNIYSPFALQMQNTHFITAIICNAFWESLDAGQQTWWLAAQEKIKTAVGKVILASLSHWSNPRALLTQFLLGDESKCLFISLLVVKNFNSYSWLKASGGEHGICNLTEQSEASFRRTFRS